MPCPDLPNPLTLHTHTPPPPPPPSILQNLPKKKQADLLQKDAILLNLTTTALPPNQGFDKLRPIVDAITSDPIGDALAPAMSFFQFRDPVLKNVAISRTTTTAKGISAAKNIYSPGAVNNTRYGSKDYPGVGSNVQAMQKINLFSFGFNKIQYRPCIVSESYTAASASAELVRIRPEGIGISATGAEFAPRLLDVILPSAAAAHAAAAWLAAQPAAHWVSAAPALASHNWQAAAITQSGKGAREPPAGPLADAGTHPLWAAGIVGSGQVAGGGDSGVDIGSCYFADPTSPFDAASRPDGTGVRVFESTTHRKVPGGWVGRW